MDPSAIGKTGNKIDDAGSTRKVSRNSGTEQASSGPASKSDTVNLTSSAKLLERLERTLATLPVVDHARVTEIKNAIENGDYEINADAIADAMIRFDQSLGE